MVCWTLWLVGGEDNSSWGKGKGGSQNATLFGPHTDLSQAGQTDETPVTHSGLLCKLVMGPVSRLWGEIKNLTGLFPNVLGPN